MNNYFPEISIIIPVYKTSLYLCDCIESIINQSFKNFEIIIVNDNSPDNSDVIIKKFQENDNRIKLINNSKNLGVAESRNKGLKIANGNYVYIMDSDDFLAPNSLITMFDNIHKTNSEVLLIDAYKYYDKDNITYFKNPIRGEKIDDLLGHAAWFLFIKKEVLKRSNDILFTSNAHPHEDTAFTFKVLSFTNALCRLNKPLIFWRQHAGQTTRIRGKKRHQMFLTSAMLVENDLRLFLKRNKNEINYKKRKNAFKRLSLSNVNLLGIYNFKTFIYFLKVGPLKKLKRFFYQKKITSSDKLIIKIFKIIIYYKKNYEASNSCNNENIIISNNQKSN